MIRTIILFSITISIFCAVQIGNSFYFSNKPDIIMDLESEQKKANEKYITAQLLSSSLNRVYQIFIQNLTLRDNEQNKKNASIDFLNYLTDILNKLEIKVLSIKPKSSEKRGKNIYNPYEIEIKCSYEKFGNFITKLEQTTLLIEIEEITLSNGLERIRSTNRVEQLQSQDYSLIISTISLNKTGGLNKNLQNSISNESKSISNESKIISDTVIYRDKLNIDNKESDTLITNLSPLIAEINIDSTKLSYQSNTDSLIIKEKMQLQNIINILRNELNKTKNRAQNEIYKLTSQMNDRNTQLLNEINELKSSLTTTQINIETKLQESFMVATQENVQLKNIIYSLKDELEQNQINNNNEIDEAKNQINNGNYILRDDLYNLQNMLSKANIDFEEQLKGTLAITADENLRLKNEIELIQQELQKNQKNVINEISSLQEEIKKKQISGDEDEAVTTKYINEENIRLQGVIDGYQDALEKNQSDIEKQLKETLTITADENLRLKNEIESIQEELQKNQKNVTNEISSLQEEIKKKQISQQINEENDKLQETLATITDENLRLKNEIESIQEELQKYQQNINQDISMLQGEVDNIDTHDKDFKSTPKTRSDNSITIAIDGYYKDQSIASRLSKALKNAGYNARISEKILNNILVYTIYVGYFDDIEEAKSHSKKLKRHLGIDNTIKTL